MTLVVPLIATLLLPVQAEPVVGTTSDTPFTFDWNGLDENGNQDIVTKVKFRFYQLDVNPPPQFGIARDVEKRLTAAGSYSIPARDVFATRGLPSGRWEVTIRFEDEFGNIGKYSSPPLVVRLESGAPSAPTKVGVNGDDGS